MSDQHDNYSWSDLRAHWNESAAKEAPQREAWTTDEMREIRTLCKKLMAKGWRGIGRYPRNGETVLAWDPMQPPYPCEYRDGKWWSLVDGDMWCASPVLWMPLPTAPATGEA